MKIHIISNKAEILPLDPNEKIVHLTFRPSCRDIILLLDTCPGLKAIQIPKSYKQTLSKAVVMYLELQHVRVIEGDVWGHRKDIDEYYEVPGDILEGVTELKNKCLPKWEIKEIISVKHDIHQDFVEYLLEEA